MRLFIAINLPADVRSQVIAATAALRAEAPEIAWVGDARLHLTLKFLGEVNDDRLENLSAAIAAVAAQHREFVMTVGGIGAFPNFRRARVVWIGVEQEARLELLHHDIELACESLGFEIEGRAFRPHLTLARLKQVLAEEQLRRLSRVGKQTDFRTDFVVRTVDLMSSELGQSGPAYRTVLSAALRSG